ncbi:MAG: hypothetical protein IT304_08985 [Dehalococcoidia bacterium]|nr:hypothetical protein [Dehalococcoidia bacterium]
MIYKTMSTEPAVALGGALTALITAIFLILRASGVGVTKDLEEGVVALITALLMFPLLTGFLIRFFVFSPETHEDEVVDAFYAGQSVVREAA